jgi:hypothetical protein
MLKNSHWGCDGGVVPESNRDYSLITYEENPSSLIFFLTVRTTIWEKVPGMGEQYEQGYIYPVLVESIALIRFHAVFCRNGNWHC